MVSIRFVRDKCSRGVRVWRHPLLGSLSLACGSPEPIRPILYLALKVFRRY